MHGRCSHGSCTVTVCGCHCLSALAQALDRGPPRAQRAPGLRLAKSTRVPGHEQGIDLLTSICVNFPNVAAALAISKGMPLWHACYAEPTRLYYLITTGLRGRVPRRLQGLQGCGVAWRRAVDVRQLALAMATYMCHVARPPWLAAERSVRCALRLH